MRSSKPKDIAKKIYLDIEALTRWLVVGGVNASLRKDSIPTTSLLQGSTSQYTIDIVGSNGSVSSPLVPLTPYNSEFKSISVVELKQALEMTRATLQPYELVAYERKYTLVDAIERYISLMCEHSCQVSLYTLINNLNQQLGKRIIVKQCIESFGPKGTPITTVILTLDETVVSHVVCIGKSYSMSCSKQKFIEGILLHAPTETAHWLLARCYGF